MTETTKRSRLDWPTISAELQAATGRQCNWFGTDDLLWMTDPNNDARKPVGRSFKSAREAACYVYGMIDASSENSAREA